MNRVTFSVLSVGRVRASLPIALARVASETQAVVIPASVISMGTDPIPTDFIVLRSAPMP
jgi:hypothetical protein